MGSKIILGPTTEGVEMELDSVPDGDLVLTIRRQLSVEEIHRILKQFNEALPGRRVLILDEDLELRAIDNDKQLARIEQKLDTLIEALAADGDEEPEYTLDGDLIPPMRDELTPL